MPNIGGFTLSQFPVRSNSYADGMNHNMIKASTLLQPSVISRSTALPALANDNDCYIDPATRMIATWLDGQWYTISPRIGAWIYVQDANEYAHYNELNEWVTGLDLDGPHAPIERTLAFYNPGLIRPAATLFYYVAGMEFTIPQNAPGSGAVLDTAPTGQIAFPIATKAGISGTITFAAASTLGVISFPAEVVVHASIVDNEFTPADFIRITSPADLLGAQGLAVTIRGKIRAMD